LPSYEEATTLRTKKVREEKLTKYDDEKTTNFYDF